MQCKVTQMFISFDIDFTVVPGLGIIGQVDVARPELVHVLYSL